MYLFTLRISDETALAIFVASIARDGIVANFGECKTYARYGLFDFGNNIACTVRVCITLFIT